MTEQTRWRKARARAIDLGYRPSKETYPELIQLGKSPVRYYLTDSESYSGTQGFDLDELEAWLDATSTYVPFADLIGDGVARELA